MATLRASTSVTPPATHFHSTVVHHNQLYVFGGKGNGCFNTTHVYDIDLNQWTLLNTENTPDERYGHCAVMYNNEMIVYGGCDNLGVIHCDFQVLNLENNKWHKLTFTGDNIQGRLNHSMNIVGDLMIIYGGINTDQQVFNNLFIVDLKDKVIHSVTIQSDQLSAIEDGRFGHVSIADKKDEKTINLSVFGGRNNERDFSKDFISFTIDLESYTASAESIQHDIALKTCRLPNSFTVFGTVTVHEQGLFFYGGMPIAFDFDRIPEDVIHVIYEYLELHDIYHMSAVSRSSRFATLSSDNKYWKDKYESVVARPEYSTIIPSIKLDNSNTAYKSAIKSIIYTYYEVPMEMGNTQKEIKKYIQKSVKIVRYGGFSHGYIGARRLKGLFTSVKTKEDMMQRFGTTLKDFRYAKAVIVGDGAVGKTSLMITIAGNPFPKNKVPTTCANYSLFVPLFNSQYDIAFWETSEYEDYDRLRPVMYYGSDVFLVCFSLVCPSSLYNIIHRWIPETMHHCPEAAILLIGTKQDLRDDQDIVNRLNEKGEQPISYHQGLQLAKDMGCIAYLETSSSNRVNIQKIPEYLVYTSLLRETIKSLIPSKCLIA